MNIHEYQAKAVLREFGVPVPDGYLIASLDDVIAAAAKLPGPIYVVKSQIHAGGRGQGKFKELGPEAKGGVRIATSLDEVRSHAAEMLGNTLVTTQTGPAGKQVNRLYVEEGFEIEKELYLSAAVDSTSGQIAFTASSDGGIDIETIAREAPEKVVIFSVDPATGVMPQHERAIANALGLSGDLVQQAGSLVARLYAAFVAKDMSLLEINPLIVSKSGELKCLDAKIGFDENALYRHPDIMAMREDTLDDGVDEAVGPTAEMVNGAERMFAEDGWNNSRNRS